MTTVQLLEAAKEKIGTPEKWCKDVYARSEIGRGADYRTADACQWCLDGALLAIMYDCPNRAAYAKAWSMFEQTGITNIIVFNDDPDTTHGDVMSALDRAIELAKKEDVDAIHA